MWKTRQENPPAGSSATETNAPFRTGVSHLLSLQAVVGKRGENSRAGRWCADAFVLLETCLVSWVATQTHFSAARQGNKNWLCNEKIQVYFSGISGASQTAAVMFSQVSMQVMWCCDAHRHLQLVKPVGLIFFFFFQSSTLLFDSVPTGQKVTSVLPPALCVFYGRGAALDAHGESSSFAMSLRPQ